MTSPPCPECDQPLPRGGYSAAVLASQLLDVQGNLATSDPFAAKLGFCDRGLDLARSIHASAHRSGATPRQRRKAKRWLREANKRLGIWQTVGPRAPFRHAPAPGPR
jgi:hypothetical protein